MSLSILRLFAFLSRRLQHREGAVRIVPASVLGAMLMVVLASASGAAQAAAYATGGSSPYRNTVLWLTWGDGVNGSHGQVLTNGSSSSAIMTVAGGTQLVVSCSLSNITHADGGDQRLLSYRPGTWQGDSLDDLYNIGGTGTANQLISGISRSGGTAQFAITCGSTLGGIPYRLKGVVMADAESINANVEYVQARASGTWNVVEMRKNLGAGSYQAVKTQTTASTQTVRFGPGNDNNTAAVTFLAFNDTAYAAGTEQVSMDFAMRGGGVTAIAIGLLVPYADFGDAPASYGSAMHLVNDLQFLPDNLPADGVARNLNVAGYNPGGLAPPMSDYLGTRGPDTEQATQSNAAATGDDNFPTAGSTEENAWPQNYTITVLQKGEQLSQAVACSGSGVVAGWIDFDRSGAFDAAERTSATCSGGVAQLSWTVPHALSVGDSYVRLRYASDASEILGPTGIATDGEVEDHLIRVIAPSLTVAKASNSGDGVWYVREADTRYQLTVSNLGQVATGNPPAVATETVTVLDELPAGILPAWTGTHASNGWSCTFSGQQVTCATDQVIAAAGNPGSSSTIDLPVNVTLDAVGSPVNHASVGGGRDPHNGGVPPVPGTSCADSQHCASLTLTVPPPSVGYSKTATLPGGATEVTVGDEIAYAVTVVVSNATTADELTFTDTLGTGLTLGTVTPGAFTCNAANPLVCTLPADTVPGTYVLAYTATVNAQASGTVVNAVVGSGTDAPACSASCTVTTPFYARPILANDDALGPVNGATGGPAGNAYGNDTLNGVPVTPSTITGTVVTPAVPAVPGAPVPVLDPATGAVTVPPGTPAGDYTITYQICEILNPTNCDTAVVTVTVEAAPIQANDDTLGPVNGTAGGPAGNAYTNDTLNGVPVTPSTITGTVVTPATPLAPGAPVPVLDPATGAVTVPPDTPAGDYTITYQICEILNPANCDTAVVTVTVEAAPIQANDDTLGPVNGTAGGPAGNAYTNDTLNGVPVTPSTITGTVVTPATSLAPGAPVPLLDPATGAVTVPPGTPAGDYTITYQICEILNPTNCDTAVVTVTVEAAPIQANDDTLGPVNGATGGPAGNAYTNDTLNGVPVTPSTITGTVVTPATPLAPGAPVPVLDPATGAVTVPPGTPAGDYAITYRICETLNPANCDTAVVTVTVEAAPIQANDDAPGPVNGATGGPAGNAYTNDTLNGVPVTPSTITGTVVTPAVPAAPGAPVPELDPATGDVLVPAGTPAGNYEITYRICEVLNPTNCDTAVVTVTVEAAPIQANDDVLGPVNGSTGGPVGNAYTNDTLNGVPVTPSTITGTVVTPSTPLAPGALVPVLDPATGMVNVPAGTPAGDYAITYRICEILNPANCDTAVVTVTVEAAPIQANDDAPGPVNGTTGGPAGNAYTNDTLNGVPVTPSTITGTVVTPAVPAVPGAPVPVLDPATGDVLVPAGTPAGNYEIGYRICEVLNPSNCDTAVVRVRVDATPIDASDDTPPPVNGADGGTTPSVLDNDTLGGVPVTPDTVDLTPGTSPHPGLVMNPDGTITVAPGIPAGTYVYPYTICETLVPSNCATAQATVVVTAPAIDAVDDVSQEINDTQGGLVPSVLGNDLLNHRTLDPADVTLAPGASPHPGLAMNPDGTITVAPGTPAGTYLYPYTICDVVNPANCDTAQATVRVVSDLQIRVLKSAAVREVSVGDLVRYTLTIENIGNSDLLGGSIVDTPPAGFSYVEGSLLSGDADRAATVSGQSPLRFEGVDVPAGSSATLVYVMRVGAGVRAGSHANQAQAHSAGGLPVSNVATAEVTLTADAVLDDSLVFGTVFDDRDGDGWQDSAALSGVRVQGGFAPGAYIAGSTTLDRGNGPQPLPDASSPLLHGIEVGAIGGRQSVADPVAARQVVVRQRLRELAFSDDFVLTSAQGMTLRMDAAGNTTVERSGEAARGLNAAMPTVERRVAVGDGGYVVDFVIGNVGIDERGIPGVRIASVEGLLVETDQYGRYHLAGVSGGAWERGRNFILKVDPATLPAGAELTTDNPLLRRITPGIPARFDFGVKLPQRVIEGGTRQVELELGEVFFAPGSAEVRQRYLPAIEAMAAQVRSYGGGEIVIDAGGDHGLAFQRAEAVRQALLAQLDPVLAARLTVSARANADDPGSLVAGADGNGALLGTVLFDTDQARIRPEFEPLLDRIATALAEAGGGSVSIVGHTDVRGSHAHNAALGLRRAKAVYEALARRLDPETRGKVRVETGDVPVAPAGAGK